MSITELNSNQLNPACKFIYDKIQHYGTLENFRNSVISGFKFPNGYGTFRVFSEDTSIAWIDVATTGEGFLRPQDFILQCAKLKRNGIKYVAAFGNNPITERFLKKCRFQRLQTEDDEDKLFTLKIE